MTTTTHAQRFRATRELAGLTQTEVASRLGVTQAMVSQTETGHRVPSRQWLLWAAAVLGWAPGDLDPELTRMGLPLDRIALEHRSDGRFHPVNPADAARLTRIGWTGGVPVTHQCLGGLAALARANDLAVYLLPRPAEDGSAV